MKNSEIIKRLNDLFDEEIANYPDEDLLKEVNESNEPLFERNLKYIRKLNTKAKASLQKGWWENTKLEIEKIIQKIGKETMDEHFLSQPQYAELLSLFSKFEEITEEDVRSMMTDKKMLEILNRLKEEINDDKNSDE